MTTVIICLNVIKVFINPKRNRSTKFMKKKEDLRTISQTYGVKIKSLKKEMN